MGRIEAQLDILWLKKAPIEGEMWKDLKYLSLTYYYEKKNILPISNNQKSILDEIYTMLLVCYLYYNPLINCTNSSILESLVKIVYDIVQLMI